VEGRETLGARSASPLVSAVGSAGPPSSLRLAPPRRSRRAFACFSPARASVPAGAVLNWSRSVQSSSCHAAAVGSTLFGFRFRLPLSSAFLPAVGAGFGSCSAVGAWSSPSLPAATDASGSASATGEAEKDRLEEDELEDQLEVEEEREDRGREEDECARQCAHFAPSSSKSWAAGTLRGGLRRSRRDSRTGRLPRVR